MHKDDMIHNSEDNIKIELEIVNKNGEDFSSTPTETHNESKESRPETHNLNVTESAVGVEGITAGDEVAEDALHAEVDMRFEVGQRVQCKTMEDYNIWEPGEVLQKHSDYFAYLVRLDIGYDHIVPLDVAEFIEAEIQKDAEPTDAPTDALPDIDISPEDLQFDLAPESTEPEETKNHKPCRELQRFRAQLPDNRCVVCGDDYPQGTIMRFCTCECHGRHSVKIWCERCYQRHREWNLPSVRVYLLIISFFTLTALHIYWWVTYFRHKAGPNVADLSCTTIDKIFIGYFTSTTFCIIFPAIDALWPVSVCNDKTRWYSFTASIILGFLSLLCFILWGIVDFLQLDDKCSDSIREVGGVKFFHAFQVFAYVNFITFVCFVTIGPYYVWKHFNVGGCGRNQDAINKFCKNGHRLRQYESTRCILCNSCKKVKSGTNTMYVCHQCGYGICEDCALSDDQEPVGEGNCLQATESDIIEIRERSEQQYGRQKKRDPGSFDGDTNYQQVAQEKEFEHWKHQRGKALRRLCKEHAIEDSWRHSKLCLALVGFACTLLLSFIAIHVFWWVAFFLHNAAPDIMGSSSCNFFPELFLTYFILSTLCCAIAGVIYKFQKSVSFLFLVLFGILVLGLFITLFIGVVHYFQMGQDCLDSSRDLGSGVFSFGMASFAWIFLIPCTVIIILLSLVCLFACGCFLGYPSCSIWRDPIQEVKGNSRDDGPYKVTLLATPTGPSGMTGFRAWHTSIEIEGKEYYFDGTGIETSAHRRSHNSEPHLEIEVGWTHRTAKEMLEDLVGYFGQGYHLLGKNCNSFSDCALFYLFQIRLHPEFTMLERKGRRCCSMRILCWCLDCDHNVVDFHVEDVIDQLRAILPALDANRTERRDQTAMENVIFADPAPIISPSHNFVGVPAVLELGSKYDFSGGLSLQQEAPPSHLMN